MKNRNLIKIKRFTILELLVVIAVLAILMTLLLPSLSKAKESAKAAVCLSQLKQLGISYMQYTKDSSFKTLKRELQANKMWMAKLYKYHQSRELMKCPSTTHETSGWGSSKTGWVGDRDWMIVDGELASGSYGFSFYLTTRGPLTYYKSVGSVAEPSNTPVLTGSNWVDHRPARNYAGPPADLEGTNDLTERVLINRHFSKKNNSLQVDGGAKTYHLKNTLQFEWHRNFQHNTLVIP
ncbi:MAG: type II secretion system GspH family protein [Lentisphaeraceae bacterium]|nr:type II secretion system GspH family protein [Lentisphaeraceae bacterium]